MLPYVKRSIFSVLILLVAVGFCYGQSPPFTVGENLVYSLHFNVLSMGRGQLTVAGIERIQGEDAYHIVFQARTSKFADRIYRVRDRVDVWIRQSDLTTLQVNKEISEGNYQRSYRTTLDYANSRAITNRDTVTISGAVRDPYSLFYVLRTLPLKIDQIFDFTTIDRKKLTDLQVVVAGRETVETPAGTFRCLVAKPFRAGKTLLKNEGDMKIWFSDDERRLPVQIKIKIKYGSMLLQLTRIN